MNLATESDLTNDTQDAAETESTHAEPITPAILEAWALDPENYDRAVAFGKRLIFAKDVDTLRELPSLGDFEDRATEWAIDNQMRAKLLVMKLIGKLAPKTP